MSPQATKLPSGKWVVIGTNPDGSPFVIKCPDEAHATALAQRIKGKVKRQKKGR